MGSSRALRSVMNAHSALLIFALAEGRRAVVADREGRRLEVYAAARADVA